MLMSADAVARWHLLEEHHDWGDRHAEHQRLQGRTGWRHLRNLDHQQGRAGRSACRGKRISGPEEEFRSMFCSSGPGPRQAKRLLVSGCRAEIYGGCFYVAGESEFAAPLLLRDCEADGSGGAIYAQIELAAQQISCSHCKAPTSGCLELAYGHARLGNVTVATGSRLSSASSIVGAGPNASISVGGVDCRDAPGCTLSVEHLNLTRLLCPQGESRQPLADGTGEECKECPADEIRLVAPDEAGSGVQGVQGAEPESRHREHPSFVSRMHGAQPAPRRATSPLTARQRS